MLGEELVAAAKIALETAQEELVHEKTIDDQLGVDPRISPANNVLVGQFQQILDGLTNLTNNRQSIVVSICLLRGQTTANLLD
ncbi:hypothetical protein HD806DRAFT_537784 [Xylariaceae sp. AK1471]|nr:hypothetical protein HD806DRAFT_537784 [Xylariaceae sp. AK1471]